MTAITTMFCKNCGNQLSQNDMFCASCGTRVENAPENNVPADVNAYEQYPQNNYVDQPSASADQAYADPNYAQSGYTDPYYAQQEYTSADYAQQQAYATPNYAQPNYQTYTQKPKKKFPAALIAVVAVICACAVLLVFNLGTLKGTFLKTVGSGDKYYQYVETASLTSGSSRLTEQYGNALDSLSKDGVAAKSTIKLNVGDDVISMLETSLFSLAGSRIDLEWLKDIALDLDVNSKKDMMQVLAGITLNGKKLVDADCILDSEKSEVYLGLKDLNDKYLKANLGATGVSVPSLTDYLDDDALKKALPTEAELNKLINKYVKAVVHNFDNVKKSKETVSVDDIKQKLTALTVEIDAPTIKNIALDVLETAKKDKDLKKHIEKIAAYLQEKDMIEDATGVYDEFVKAIDDLLEDVNKMDENANDDMVIVLTNYVNSKHEVVGRKLEAAGKEIAHYAVVRDGKKFSFELVADGFSVIGDGTEAKDVIDGEFSVIVSDKTLCTIAAANFDTAGEYLNGTIRVTPSAELLRELDIDASALSMLSIASPTLELKIKSDKNSADAEINLLNNDSLLVGLIISAKETGASSVKVPDSKNVCDEKQAAQWASDIDIDKLISNLEKAGVPDALISMLKSSM